MCDTCAHFLATVLHDTLELWQYTGADVAGETTVWCCCECASMYPIMVAEDGRGIVYEPRQLVFGG